MATAQFHKNQRVFVKPVGTWALVEKVLPQWAKGLEKPIRIYYDVGLGREFGADELEAEQATETSDSSIQTENWRIIRARNKWQAPEDCNHHPFPGTYPTVVTHGSDWGGWRVPGAEYDQNPARIEFQARIIASSQRAAAILEQLVRYARNDTENMPAELLSLVRESVSVLSFIHETHLQKQMESIEGASKEAPEDSLQEASGGAIDEQCSVSV